MAIWLLGPDPNGQCCGCEGKTSPCDSCEECKFVVPNALWDSTLYPAYPDLAWAQARMDDDIQPTSPDCLTLPTSDSAAPKAITYFSMPSANVVSAGSEKDVQAASFGYGFIFKYRLSDIVAGTLISINPLVIDLNYLNSVLPGTELRVAYSIYLLRESDGVAFKICSEGYADNASNSVVYNTPDTFSLLQSDIDVWDGYFYFVVTCSTLVGNVNFPGDAQMAFNATIQTNIGSTLEVCPVSAAYYDGSEIKYLDCVPSSLP